MKNYIAMFFYYFLLLIFWQMDCGQIFGGKRKKRDVDKDEMDQIFCGTTIKVIDLSKKLGNYQGNIKDMVLNIHNSNNELIKWSKKKPQTNHTIGTVPPFNRKIVEI